MNHLKPLATSITLICGVFLGGISSSANEKEDEYFVPFLQLIEELDVRKRVNVLYPNLQSIFDGVQVGFVNVSTGNLTFLRRDLVVDGK